MTSSADFHATVSGGARCAQSDVVLHLLEVDGAVNDAGPPRVGLVVARSVGNAVERHRVSRRLRHLARGLLAELAPGDRLVIRALPASAGAPSATLEQHVRTALQRARRSVSAAKARR